MSFTIESFEFFLLIFVRMSGFIFAAPLYSLSNIPKRVQIGLCAFISIVIYGSTGDYHIAYNGVIGYAGLIIVELVLGLSMGYFASICMYILNFAGQIIDMEMGFSMVNVMNPTANMTTTVTGNLYTYFVILVLLASDLHRYILKAMIDAFSYIPVGGAVFRIGIFNVMLTFIKDYFIIGFRIVLPMFAAMLIVNVVLGVLAKVAPQMNMFVVGIQLKVFIGLFILALSAQYVPLVAELIYEEMKIMMNEVVKVMSP